MNIIAPIAHPRPPCRRHSRRTAFAIFVVAATLLSSPVIAQDDDLTGPAWNLADRAYRAYEAGDYKRAVEAARDAVVLRPDLPRLRVLLVNSLVAAGDLPGAVAAADQAIAAGIANDELRSTRDRLKRPAAPQTAVTAPVDAAFAAADAGYKAFAGGTTQPPLPVPARPLRSIRPTMATGCCLSMRLRLTTASRKRKPRERGAHPFARCRRPASAARLSSSTLAPLGTGAGRPFEDLATSRSDGGAETKRPPGLGRCGSCGQGSKTLARRLGAACPRTQL